MEVGYLDIRDASGVLITTRSIHIGEEVLIGRDGQCCQVHVTDPRISNRQLRVYSVIYDDGDGSDIMTLVYAEDLSSNGTFWNGLLIGKEKGGALLSDGDQLRISPDVDVFFHTNQQASVPLWDDVRVREQKCFVNFELTKRRLGSGGYGAVYMAIDHFLGRQLACKVVDLCEIRRKEREKYQNCQKDPLSSDDLEKSVESVVARQWREIEILKTLNHSNIIRIEKVFHSDNTLYIFEELMTGGDLYCYLEHKDRCLDEAETSIIIRQVLEAVKYIHARDIVHRDIKPENILMASLADTARVVLTDFGCAINLEQFGSNSKSRRKRMETSVGTLEYVAPEVKGKNPSVQERGYTKAVDLWSIGCVTTALLLQKTPFSKTRSDRRRSYETVIEAASTCNLIGIKACSTWQNASCGLQDFILKLFILDENARMTAEDALHHPWYSTEGYKERYDEIYTISTKGWRTRKQMPNIVEAIGMESACNKAKKRQLKKSIPKTPKPIEAHYQPMHLNVYHFLSAPRTRTPLPSIAEIVRELPDPPAGSKTKGRTIPHVRSEDPLHMTLAREFGNRLHLGDPEKSHQDMKHDTMKDSDQICNPILFEPGFNASVAIAPTLGHLARRIKRPLVQVSQSPAKRRRETSIFDIVDDGDVTHPTSAMGGETSHFFNASFTPINRRQSIKLGGLEILRSPRHFPPVDGVDAPKNHDAPLVSKRIPTTYSKSPQTIFHSHTTLKDENNMTLRSSLDSEVLRVLKPVGNTQSPPNKRGVTKLNWEEANELVQDDGENREFRSARAFAQSIKRRRKQNGLYKTEKEVPADLTDSIRTAHG